MVDISVFELADIQFDNPGKSKKDVGNVKKELQRAIAEKKQVLNNATGQASGDKIQKQISILQAAEQEFFEGDKFSDQFFTLCAKRAETAKQSFIAAIKLLSDNGKKTISSKAAKNYCRAEKLDYDKTAKPMFSSSGELASVKLEEINIEKDLPKFPSNAEKTYELLKAFRALEGDELKGNPPTANVMDLYDLAVYFEKSGSADAYRSGPAKVLFDLFDSNSKKYQLASASSFVTYCRSLCSDAKTYFFKDDAAKKAYDTFLLYKSKGMQDTIDMIRKLSKASLRDSGIYENCIKQIQKYFPDTKTAYAIYNKEAKLTDDPVEPETYLFTIVCSYCHTLNTFPSEADAQAAQGCVSCKKPLYKVCPKCKRKSPQDSRKCTNPACGSFFPDEKEFERAIALSRASLEAGKADEAKQYLAEARIADPSETVKTAKLDAEIRAFEGKFKLPLSNLNSMIGSRRFKAAGTYAASLPAQFPGINIAEQEKTIRAALTKCDSLYEASKRQDPVSRANTMVDILDICSDYSAAADFLKSTKPSPCQGLWANSDTKTGAVKLGWNAPKERGVLFRILRKNGSSPSADPQDGTVLADKVSEVSFTDDSVIIGSAYTYTVYSVRGDVYSSGVSAKAVSLKGVADVAFTQNGNRIRLTWTKPVNCSSVSVFRSVNGNMTELSRSAASSIEDQLEYGVQAVYHIVPNYSVSAEKAGVQFPVRITQVIDRFTISASIKNKTTAEVRWDIGVPGISIQIFVNGQMVKTVQSDPGYCTVTLPGDGVFKISAKALTGGAAKDCVSPVTVSQLSAPECDVTIDEKVSGKVTVTILPVKGIPQRVDRLVAFVRKKTDPSAGVPWVSRDEAPSLSEDIIIPASSARPGTKTIYAENEERYYVTIFAVYKDGSRELYSEPIKKPLPRPLRGNISWEIKKSIITGRKLCTVVTANRYIPERPAMKLCVGIKGKQLKSPSDPDATLVLDIPKRDIEESTTVVKETFDIPSGVKKGLPAFLFLAEKEKNQTISISWAEGLKANNV